MAMERVWVLLLPVTWSLAAQAPRLQNTPRPAVEDKVKDRFTPAPYDRQQIGGLLGERMKANLEGRLLKVDERALLAGFQKRPGNHPWIGEHIGKFLHAASNTWAYTGDGRLKTMLDRMARALLAAQLPDGYLGTYTDNQRWTSWDVWVHQYDLIGLLSYYQVSGDQAALDAARKIGDLLSQAFGPGPGQRDIIQAGAHVGMAATSVLEPICLLYRYTGEKRYLDFAHYIARACDRPEGPNIISSLLKTGSVYKTADAKAHEMMSNLVGLVDLYRLTGEEAFLKPALVAWKDIVAKRLYVTGTTSSHEYFQDDLVLFGEESAGAGECCATVTWLQLNWQLLRLTGEPQYADEIERTLYNQLLGAQDPRNGSICPFTPLLGRKRPESTIHCAVSSGPRGISMIPQLAWGTREGGLALLLYVPGEVTLPVSAAEGALEVTLRSDSRFLADGSTVLTVRPSRRAKFPVFLRVPSWCKRYTASVGGVATPGVSGQLLRLERLWQPGDRIDIKMDLTVQALSGGQSYPDFLAIQRGPQVLALDSAVNLEVPFLHRAALASPEDIQLLDASKRLPKGWAGSQAYAVQGIAADRPLQGRQTVTKRELLLVPFADARNYRVWLVRSDKMPFGPVALTAFGTESWSRAGNVEGSICDERSDTFRVTLRGPPAKQDWYAVETDLPEVIARVVYRHGRVYQNGGWFNTSAGKPQIQVKRTRTAAWETVATLDAYPDTSSGLAPTLRDGQPFEVKLKEPVKAMGIRILGRPGGAFSSCAELAAYGQ